MHTPKTLITLILAAGESKRMLSETPKTLHSLGGQPVVAWIMNACAHLPSADTCVVVSPKLAGDPRFQKILPASTRVAIQEPPRGTGDAVCKGLDQMPSTLDRDVLVVLGDTPLLTPQTLQEFHAHYIQQKADLSVLAVRPPNPLGYGRLITSGPQVERIVEEKEADETTKAITLCNGGAMILGPQAQTMLSQIDSANKAGEYYLTDLVYLLKIKGLSVTFFEAPFEEALGINTRADLAKAEAILQGRLRQKALDQGVTLMDPESTYLSFDTSFSEDVTLFPHVFLGPGVTLGRDSTVFAFSVLENTLLKPGARVGPFCHLRHGTTVGEGAVIGNFVEVKQSVIGTGTSAKHLSYIGNATIGAHANIGAGTITCNYDGQAKHETVIGDKAFIGSNSSLIAPVTIGDHALIAAGSVITKSVPENTLAVGRARQTHLPRKRPQAP